MTVFDILNSISFTKQDLSNEEGFDKEYVPFLVNKFLSMSKDTLFLANIMSQMHHLPPRMQYLFYLKAVDKKKRYFKFAKKGESDTTKIDKIQQYYGINKERAIEVAELLNDEQMGNILESLDEGVIKQKRC